MSHQSPQRLREQIEQWVTQSQEQGEPSKWCELLYQHAQLDSQKVPWALMKPSPYLEDWLEGYQESTLGQRSVVIGCGLGDDAEMLAVKGFAVTALDISPTAISWCQRRFPNSSVNYTIGDILALDPAYQQAFDLVVDVRLIQSLPVNLRPQTIRNVTSLVVPGGSLLIIGELEDEVQKKGPPWPLRKEDLEAFQELGLQEISRQLFTGDEIGRGQTMRVEYYLQR